MYIIESTMWEGGEGTPGLWYNLKIIFSIIGPKMSKCYFLIFGPKMSNCSLLIQQFVGGGPGSLLQLKDNIFNYWAKNVQILFSNYWA